MRAVFRKAPLVAAIALISASPITHAQKLEEVIVTAQKRAESLQDVPISLTAMQGDRLKAAGIPDMKALADYVPNLHIADAPVNTNIYLRGMGSGNNQGFEQSVGMYIDGIYMGRGRQYRSPFVDIERVEVLRGPQGTLFGKNTVAGAVNVTTASPALGDELNGELELSAEENGGYVAEGYISNSISDTVAMRLAVKYRQTDGFIENTFLHADEPGIKDKLARFTLVWAPTTNLDVNFKYSKSSYKRVGAPSATKLYIDAATRDAVVPNRSAFANIAYLLTDTFYPQLATESKKDFTTFKDNNFGPGGKGSGVGVGINADSSDNDSDNIAINVNWTVGDYTITSVTGVSEYQYVDGADVDWLPLQFISRDDDQQFKQYSQELRITSPGGEFFDYVAGAYYDTNQTKFDRRVVIDTNMGGLTKQVLGVDNLLLLLTGGAYGADQLARNHYYKLDSDSWAVFGQGTFNFSDSLRLTVGVRYTKETKEVDTNQFIADSNNGDLSVPTDAYFARIIQASSFNTYDFNYSEDRNTDQFIPSLNVQWDFNQDTMFYVSLSKGFKSGGFTAADDGEPGGFIAGQIPPPGFLATTPSQDFEFDDEKVNAIEIGGKHTLLDGGMTLNWAAFYTEYDNLQVSVFKGIGFGVTNAAKSIVQGLEVDMQWQATDGLFIGANASYLDATYDDYKTAPCTAIQLDVDPACGTDVGFTNNDLTDERTNYAPEYSASVYFDYVYDLSAGMEWFLGGDANYRDEFFPAGDNDPIDVIDSVTKFNLRTGLRADNWELMAYGRNITDETAPVQSFDVPVLAGSHAQYLSEGSVYGVRAKYSF